MMQDSVLFFDLETSSDTILDIGAVQGVKEYHGKDLRRLQDLISSTKFIIGHNILEHDLKVLKARLGEKIVEGKVVIDTLLWSPILFANRPYHKLVKGYKLINEAEYSNPLSDSKICMKLFNDQLAAFQSLNDQFKRVLYALLKHHSGYSGFFQYLNYSAQPIYKEEIVNLLGGQYCRSIDLKEIVINAPVELVYVLSLLLTKDVSSSLSTWVLKQFPQCQNILDKLKFNNCTDPNCDYCSSKLNPLVALKEFFGYEAFRKFDYDEEISLQEKTVRAGMAGENFVAVFPTGGGKSLTFQLPALMKGQHTRQLTVVISPLVSLMKDQVDVLESRFGIHKAVAINGLLSPLERSEAIERVSSGVASILYISPESLRSPTITKLLQERSIARFVIDEAHCFSSWGQDFRVDYLFIGDFIGKLQSAKQSNYKIPVSCFTATAKPKVIEDIKNYFASRLGIQLSEYVTRAPRSNLEYEVIEALDNREKDRILIDLLDECDKPAIVYCSRTKKVQKVHELLIQNRIAATHFHGKLDKEAKIRAQDQFMKDEVDVIVATSAFGMGVDKEDVKTVIHYDISDSLENYIQEAGRAGRKSSINAKCYILYNEDDLNKHFTLVQQTKLNRKEIQQIWQAIKKLTKFRSSVSQSALQIAKAAGWETEIRDLENKVTASISALEQQGFLLRSQNTPRVFASSLLVRNLETALKTVRAAQSLTDQQRERCSRLLQRLIKEEVCRIDYLADTLELRMSEIQETITNLRQLGLLGDAQDLTAFIDARNSKSGSRSILEGYIKVEKALFQLFSTTSHLKYSIRELNQRLLDKGVVSSSTHVIHALLNYWDKRNFISKIRTDREKDIYSIKFQVPKALEVDIEQRLRIASECFIALERKQDPKIEHLGGKEEIPVEFSLLEITETCRKQINEPWVSVKEVERALLYLNHIKCIQLEGGFMVVYNRLNLSDVDRSKRTFTNENYSSLGIHYENRIQQIHMVGEYARKRIQNYREALTYIDDYFSLPLDSFREKYFFRRGPEISRPLTKEKFTQIIVDLNTEQTAVIQSKDKNILVLAGPGSGKTKVLVHKIASLLLLEDVKPEQFLMLTFSKAASLEFKNRVYKLVPEFSGLIRIATFHGYCFELLGQLGNLEKSQNIISDCIQAIEKEEIDVSSISNKSVLLIDEFQDVNEHEWNLIKKIMDIAGEIRVVAVGDDDQNIFQFRNSSNRYMKFFREDLKARVFNLSQNYRSYQRLVSFNNQILTDISFRMKNDSILESALKGETGSIHITRHTSDQFYEALVKRVQNQYSDGTVAVLTRKNDEAVILAALLRKAGLSVRLLVGLDEIRLRKLVEIAYFESIIRASSLQSGLISFSDWEDGKKALQEKYRDSKQLKLCNELIRLFEDSHKEPYGWTDWLDFANHINPEDAVKQNRGEVIVSTFHKSKGKEFDEVHLYLNDFRFSNQDELRLLYVACTRAKQKLSIHTNGEYFEKFDLPGLIKETDEVQYGLPQRVEILLTHHDVQLGSQRYPQCARIISNLNAGAILVSSEVKFAGQTAEGLGTSDGNILLYSKKFINQRYTPLINKGYSVEEGEVEYVVNWYDKKTEKEVLVVLPSVKFVRRP